MVGLEKRNLGEEQEKSGQVTQGCSKGERQPLTDEQRAAKKEKKKAKKARRIEQSHRDREIVEGLKLRKDKEPEADQVVVEQTPTKPSSFLPPSAPRSHFPSLRGRSDLPSSPVPRQMSGSGPFGPNHSSGPISSPYSDRIAEYPQTQPKSNPRGSTRNVSGGELWNRGQSLGLGNSQFQATSHPFGISQDGPGRAFEPRRRSRSPNRLSWSGSDSRRERPKIPHTHGRFDEPKSSPYGAPPDPLHRPSLPPTAPLHFQNRQLPTAPNAVQAAARLEKIEANNAKLSEQLASMEQRQKDLKRAEAAKEQKILTLMAQSEYLKDRRARYQENLEYERLGYSRFRAGEGAKDPVALARIFEVYEKAVERIHSEFGRTGELQTSIGQQLAELR